MKTIILTGFLLSLTFLFNQDVLAGRFWVAASSSNWNNTANWSATSGGAGGASVPGSADDVNFDLNGLGNCVINATVAAKTFTVTTGYTGIINQGVNTISVVGAGSFSGGTFTGGSANMTIGGGFTLNGTTFTSTSAILEIGGILAAFTTAGFVHNSGTVRMNGSGAFAMTGISPTFFSLEFVGKANTYTLSSTGVITVMNSLNLTGSLFYNLATGVIDVKGNINSTSTASGCGGDAIININGTGTQTFTGSTIAGAGAIPQLNINTTGTLALVNFPAVSNNFTYTAGTLNAGTSTFCFTHGINNAYSITGTLAFNNIAFVVNTSLLTLTIVSTITANADLTIAGAGNLVLNTGSINVNGNINLTNTSGGGGGSATINIVGAANVNLDGSAIVVNQSRLPVININKSGGTLSLLGNISFAANVGYTAGAIAAGTSTCYLVNNLTISGSFSLFNLTVHSGANTTIVVTTGSVVSVNNTFDLESGANNITINTGTIAVQGNIIDNNTNLGGGGGNGVILINGTGNQTITTTGVIDQGRFPGVTINKTSGTLVLPLLMTVRFDWTYIAGTVDALTNNSTVVFENTMNITGTHTLNNTVFNGTGNYVYTTAAGTTLTVPGTMTITGANNVVLNSGNINLSGNMVLTNTSIGGGGTTVISFLGAANQSITNALPIYESALPAVTINKTGGTLIFPSILTVRSSWSYTAGTYDVSTNNSTIVFAGPLAGGITMTGTHTLNNVTLAGTNNNIITVATGTILTVTGTLTTTGVNNVFINTPITGSTAIKAQGNININNTSLAGGGTGIILINGTTAQAFTSTATAGLGQLPYISIQKVTGTLTMTGTFSESRDWTYISGTVDATSNLTTVDFGWTNLSISSAGMNFYNVIFNSNTSTLANTMTVLGNLTINGTGTLAPGANTINLAGNWTNRLTAGFTESTSSVNLNGSALQTITTPAGENFTNLTINNSSSGIQLANNIQVATALNMTLGNIDLNSNSLTLGLTAVNSGTLSRTSGTIIKTGSFIRWFKTGVIATGSASGLFPMGTSSDYRPLFVSAPAAGPTTGGTVAITFTNATTNTSVSIVDLASTVTVRKDLNWTVTTALLAGGVYNMQVQGTGYGLIGAVSDLRLTLVGSVVGVAGTNAGTISNPQVNRTTLSLANLTNSFYVGSINASATPLPITLVYFTAFSVHQKVDLKWETATEKDNDYFTVLRSRDGSNWTSMTTIPGKGNSSSNSYYETFDDQPLAGQSFYKLQNTDFDGQVYFSPVRMINTNEMSVDQLSIYPNPVSNTLTITHGGDKAFTIQIVNRIGQLISTIPNNISSKVINVANFPAGIYFISILIGESRETKTITIRR